MRGFHLRKNRLCQIYSQVLLKLISAVNSSNWQTPVQFPDPPPARVQNLWGYSPVFAPVFSQPVQPVLSAMQLSQCTVNIYQSLVYNQPPSQENNLAGISASELENFDKF